MITVDVKHGGPTKRGRRASHDLAPGLERFGLAVRERALKYGDVQFRGCGPNGTTLKIGIELKKTSDLITSLLTGKLGGHQLSGMLGRGEGEGKYDQVYLLHQGIVRAEPGTGILQEPMGKGRWRDCGHGKRRMLYTDLMEWVHGFYVMSGRRIHYLQSSGQQETLWRIVALYTWWDKPWGKHASFKVIDEAQPDAIPLPVAGHRRNCTCHRCTMVRMLAQVPMIGWSRSRRVERHFGTDWDRIHHATEADWQEIDGIGKGIARTVYTALHGEPKAQSRFQQSGRGAGAGRGPAPRRVSRRGRPAGVDRGEL